MRPRAFLLWITASLLGVAATGAPSRADTDLGVGLELGALFSPDEGARRDAAGLFSVVPAAAVGLGDGWRLRVGLGVPLPTPSLGAQLPVAVERTWPAGWFARAGLRPAVVTVALCSGVAERCPRDQAADPRDRGGWAAGALGEGGGGYRGRVGADVSLAIVASYLAGGWFARGGSNERPLGGPWQGFAIAFELELEL